MSHAVTRLSDIIIQNPQVRSFPELLELVGRIGFNGATMLEFDLKPDFPDTPRTWETKLEWSFTWWGR